MTKMRDVCDHYGVASLAQCPPAAFIIPEFYPKGGLLWTLQRLDYLTIEDRKRVCAELREIYLTKGAKAYGEHLNAQAKTIGSAANKTATQQQKAALPNRMQERLNRIKESRSNRPSILGMSEGKAHV